MSIANQLMAGVAQILEDAGVGTWQSSGTYAGGADRPIYVRGGPASPDRVIVVSHYPVRQEPWTRDTVEGIQVINRGPRGDPRPADDDVDAIRAALDGLRHVDVGGVHVSSIVWQSGTPLGRDDLQRFEHSNNYYVYTARPNTHRED